MELIRVFIKTINSLNVVWNPCEIKIETKIRRKESIYLFEIQNNNKINTALYNSVHAYNFTVELSDDQRNLRELWKRFLHKSPETYVVVTLSQYYAYYKNTIEQESNSNIK